MQGVTRSDLQVALARSPIADRALRGCTQGHKATEVHSLGVHVSSR